MSLQLKPLPKSTPAYSQNNSLLLQFILYELITAYYQIKQLNDMCRRLQASNVEPLLLLARKLIDQECGVLTKLKNYSTLYLKNSKRAELPLEELNDTIKKSWLLCFNAYELLDSLDPSPSEVLQQTNKLVTSLKPTTKLLAAILPHSHHDENVVLFLIRYYKHFDELFAPNFIGKLIAKMYPKGMKEAEALLLKRYKARGFDYLLPFISNKIAEI